MYKLIDVTLDQWRNEVLKQYPNAKIVKAPEELGGTRDAWVGDVHVGDWDGSGYGAAGRIKKKVDTN